MGFVLFCQQVHKKMLNLTKHGENANQNHGETPPHTCHHGHHLKDISVGKDVQKRLELSCCNHKKERIIM